MSKQGTAEEIWNRIVAFLIRAAQKGKQTSGALEGSIPYPQTLRPFLTLCRGSSSGKPGVASRPRPLSSKLSETWQIQVAELISHSREDGPVCQGCQFITSSPNKAGRPVQYHSQGGRVAKSRALIRSPSGLDAPYLGLRLTQDSQPPSPTFKSHGKLREPGGGEKKEPMFIL